jgi:hypothetical protein
MKVVLIEEAGYQSAMLGLSLSHNSPIENMPMRAEKLAFKQLGHNKVLESIEIWLDVTAPLFWWRHADTYRMSTKQSQSTMHTIEKRILLQSDFLYPIQEDYLAFLNRLITEKKTDIEEIQNALPDGFMQRRVWKMCYKTLQNIHMQREHHRLKRWRMFLEQTLSQVAHPELINQNYERVSLK